MPQDSSLQLVQLIRFCSSVVRVYFKNYKKLKIYEQKLIEKEQITSSYRHLTGTYKSIPVDISDFVNSDYY